MLSTSSFFCNFAIRYITNIRYYYSMKFLVSSSLLSSRLQTVGRVIVSKNTLSILDSFLFETQDNKLIVTASDNEITITSWLEVIESEKDIRFVVNAKTIQDSIKEIPEQPLAFYINENTMEITVQYQNGEYHFMGQSADDFPLPAKLEEEVGNLNIPAHKLLNGISRALFATADDTLRPIMNGVLFHMENNSLTLVASDGHKMSCNSFYNVEYSMEGRFILPKKPAQILKTLLGKEEQVNIVYNNRGACITTEHYVLYCRLVEGRYPNYASVIPQDQPNRVVINRNALLSTLRRILVFSNATSALVKIRLDMGSMIVSSQDIDFSKSAEESILCDFTGFPMSIGFKGTFLMELLNNLDGEDIVIKLADPSRAGVIVPLEDAESESVMMLLMPMMVNQ